MVAIKNILFIATAVAAAVIPRDATQVLNDLKTVNSDTQALTKAINNYNGGLFAAAPIEDAESKLDKDIKSTNSDTQASAAASESDANNIINYINQTLEPSIKASIKALESKKSQIQSAGLTSTVQGDLKTLKSDTDDLGSSLLAKTPADKQTAAKAALAKVDADLQEGINAFA